MNGYHEFLRTKALVVPSYGVTVEREALHDALFGFQRDLVWWALRKGRAALFAGTGMGKTLMQLAWAQHIPGRTLILAPLAVAQQTEREGQRFDIAVRYARKQADATGQITVTNYEMLEHFDPTAFDAVVLDESSILKSFTGKTRTALIETFADTPYRLCCTATPAPNDIGEIANHAEFLGVMTRVEMLATFFVHDDEGWRLKGHAKDAFYRWLASWGMSLRSPSDLGYPDDGFALPPLTVEPMFIPVEHTPEDQLFFTGLKGITERTQVRRETTAARVQAAAELIQNQPDVQWLAWVGMNDEGRMLADLLGDDCILVEGADTPEAKAAGMLSFADGQIRTLITKSKISGFGMNFQNCSHMVFVGLGDSWEQYYQSIRRCWRFGQTQPVHVHVVLSDIEDAIWSNVQHKEKEAEAMMGELVKHVSEFEKEEIAGVDSKFVYDEREASGEGWRLLLGDSTERLRELPGESVDFTVFSPPFLNLYVYSNTERDLGNSSSADEYWTHYHFITKELWRLTRPGRLVAVHVAQVPLLKERDGVIGLRDYRGAMIAHMVSQNFVYHGEVAIDKDPQAQAIRTKSKGLLFVQMHKDSSWSRPALADYLLLFRKPGENAVPIQPDLTNDEWIEMARPIWYGIRESDTLNVAEARSEEDERHICPLQLGTIERAVRLWSNKGETVLDPFAGIGSTGYEAIRLGRRFVGCELKPEYFRVAVRNLQRIEAEVHQVDLFEMAGLEVAR